MATPRKDPKAHLPKGRPSKYEDSMHETVVSCMQKGFIVDEVCAELGIHRDTFFEWIKTHPDFSDSYKKGKASFSAFWAKMYKKVMMGIPLAPAKKTVPKRGQKKSTSKAKKKKEEAAIEFGKANPAMMIFYMKAHCGWRETIVNRDIVEFADNIPDNAKSRLSKIFGEAREKSSKIKPKVISKTAKEKKSKSDE